MLKHSIVRMVSNNDILGSNKGCKHPLRLNCTVKVRKLFFRSENSDITREHRNRSNLPLQIVFPFCPITRAHE